MSRSLNRVDLLGHLGKDAEVRFTPSGVQRAAFSLATSRRWKPANSNEWKEETDWHNVILWRCENIVQYLTKGRQVFVSGRLQTRSYEDKEGVRRYVTEVIAESLILLGGPAGEARGGAQRPAAPSSASQSPGDEMGVTDDDVPF